jgi:cell division protein FtsI (penicillin-binding protein 3)
MDIKKDILWRVYLCFIGVIVLCVCVLGKAIYIQQAEGKYWIGMSDSLHVRNQPILAERGTIYSEDGNMLSTSVPNFDIYIDFGAQGLRDKEGKRFYENVDSLCINLANLFKDEEAKDFATYKQEFLKAYKENDRYYLLKRKVNFDQYLQLRDFPLVRLGRNKSGFIIDSKDKRINPYVLLANRTIGLSRQNLSKNVGLELTYDSLLRGMDGQRVLRYAAGAYIPVEGSELDPIHGKDIVTTLDTYIQDVAENALMDMLVNNNSKHGCAIVMETATGKIKAIANLGKQEDGSYFEDFNYGIGKTTEPGSVFKLATLMCLLEDKHVELNTIVNCEGGSKYFYGLRIKDSHLGTYNTTVKDAFAKSSNVAFAKLANQFYKAQPQKFLNHLHKMRLDTKTGIDIVAASGYPTIKKAKQWSATTLPYMAHGYEELVTPLHMLTLYNAVANNGKMMKPYLVSEIKYQGIVERKIEPVVLEEKICSKETIKMLQEALFAVVHDKHGTGYKVLNDSAYNISGKTGTAVSALDNKGYNKDNKIYQSSFIGYFPSEAPKYTIAVVIQNTNKSKLVYGADVSGAVFKEISDKLCARFLTSKTYPLFFKKDTLLQHVQGTNGDVKSITSFLKLNTNKDNSKETWKNLTIDNGDALVNNTNMLSKNVVPDVKGMGLKDALYILENRGLKVTIQGKGKVIAQNILAGVTITKGQTINLILN